MKHTNFPLFIDSTDKEVIVYGCGVIATRRIKTLLKFKFQIDVIGRTPSKELEALLNESENCERIKFHRKPINDSDISKINKETFLVVAATSDRNINNKIAARAKECGVFHSIADAKDECDVFFPAVRTKDEVVIGIAGDGSDHKKTRKIADNIRTFLENN